MEIKIPDAEIIASLKAIEREGSLEKAAFALGINVKTVTKHRDQAKQRNLTAQTVLRDPLIAANVEIADLKRQLREAQVEADTAAKIRAEIHKIASHDPEPPAWLVKEGSNGFRGMPTLLASDWHYGEVVEPHQVGGVNEFNADIAAKRIKKMATRTVDLAFNHMGKAKTVYPGIVFALGGDMISGDIHEELARTNDRTSHQCVNEVTDLIAGCIELFGQKFGRVFVPATPGNHGRSTKKPHFKNRTFTSFEWNIYCNLAREFKRSKNVQFLIPEGPDVRWNVYDHRYLMTHGDNLGVKGGDGIIGLLGPVRRGEIKIRNSEARIGRDFDTMIMGHWHSYLPLPGLIVNPTLKGFDEFAHLALRAAPEPAAQALWFTHPEHGITAHWRVYVGEHTKIVAKEVPTLSWKEIQ